MSDPALGLLMLVLIIVVIMLGFPTAFTLMGLGIVFGFIAYFKSGQAFADNLVFDLMVQRTYGAMTNDVLISIPLFVLMGYVMERGALVDKMFYSIQLAFRNVPASLAVATLVVCTFWGIASGLVGAVVVLMGVIALNPMLRAGYDVRLASGVITAGGTLGILIPPSVILVVYAISTEQNIVKLFQAALIPGLLAALFYCVVIALTVRLDPDAGPAHAPVPRAERRPALFAVWPTLVVAAIVLGGIYGGVFTPTEGASVGAVAMLAVGFVTRKLSWAGFLDSLRITAETSALIFTILLGAEVFNAFLALSQLPAALAEWIAGLGLAPLAVVGLLLAAYILLGAVMDELAMILLTLPIFFPVVSALDFGLTSEEVAIWFGILVLIVVGIGLTAPPIGLNVFVVGAIARDVPLARIYMGVIPFLIADVVRLVLVLLVPGLALWLVRLWN